ncbi:MAG: GPW/gp25 family protein [Gaiellaceae bacterium]
MSEPLPQPLEHLGRGWAFPVRWSTSGAVALVESEDDVREAILLLLRTAPDERVMRPGYGAGVDRYVFAGRTPETQFRLQEDVRIALVRHEPRILVEQISAELPADDEARIDVVVDYRVDEHRPRQSLVFPFYLQQPEAG